MYNAPLMYIMGVLKNRFDFITPRSKARAIALVLSAVDKGCTYEYITACAQQADSPAEFRAMLDDF